MFSVNALKWVFLGVVCVLAIALAAVYFLYIPTLVPTEVVEINDPFYTSPDVVFGEGLGATTTNVRYEEDAADPIPDNEDYADLFYPEEFQPEF